MPSIATARWWARRGRAWRGLGSGSACSASGRSREHLDCWASARPSGCNACHPPSATVGGSTCATNGSWSRVLGATSQGPSRQAAAVARPPRRRAVFHSGLPAAAVYDVGGRQKQKLHVEPERTLVDVLPVELHHLRDRDRRCAVHLPNACHPGAHREPASVRAPDLRVLLRDEGSGADEAHPTGDHIEKLRQLIERGSPQPPPGTREARITADLEQSLRCLVHLQEGGLASVSAIHHRAELEHSEWHPVLAYPPLTEENRAGGIHLDQQGDGQPDRGEDDEQDRPPDQVEGALESSLGPAAGLPESLQLSTDLAERGRAGGGHLPLRPP